MPPGLASVPKKDQGTRGCRAARLRQGKALQTRPLDFFLFLFSFPAEATMAFASKGDT